MKTWTVRLANKSDQAEINKLYNTVFKGSRNHEAFFWKFQEAFGEDPIITVAVDEKQKIIGCYASTTAKLKFKNEIIKVAQPVDNAIYEEYRSMGIQRAMYELWEQEARKQKIPFIYGFPIAEVLEKGVKGLGYRIIGNIPVLRTEIKQSKYKYYLRKIYKKLTKKFISDSKNYGSIKISRADNFDQQVNILNEKLAKNYKILVPRNMNFLNWRIFKSKKGKFTVLKAERESDLVGYIALRYRIENKIKVGYIFDLYCLEEEQVLNSLLDSAKDYFKTERISEVKFFIPAHTFYYQKMLRTGFKLEDWKPFTFVSCIFDEEYAKDVLNMDNWFISLLDTDL